MLERVFLVTPGERVDGLPEGCLLGRHVREVGYWNGARRAFILRPGPCPECGRPLEETWREISADEACVLAVSVECRACGWRR